MSRVSINKISKFNSDDTQLILAERFSDLNEDMFTEDELKFIKKQLKEKIFNITVNRLERWICIYFFNSLKSDINSRLEEYRRTGNDFFNFWTKNKNKNLLILDVQKNAEYTSCFLEGMALGAYNFDKYKKDANNNYVFNISSKALKENDVEELNKLIGAVYKCKDLVNEPHSYLTTSKYAEEIKNIAKSSGLKLNILDKLKISSLRMGGILAVNKGSSEPPFLAIAEWNPDNAINKKPYILVGKGITFDSGGYSMKTAMGMEEMKFDMAGSAVAINVISLIALHKLPIYIIGLIPVTDNMINDKAQVPGDIITMHNGSTVEILSTDAEGRLILADALSYAQKFKPELVIDVATLTGAAHIALGKYTIFAIGKDYKQYMQKLLKSGAYVYERLVEFPLWDEYAESLKSPIADMKNVGARHAGAIVASKFLEHFTDYPWIHLDIAGPAYFTKSWNYHSEGATGIGVRLLYNFFKNIAKNKSK